MKLMFALTIFLSVAFVCLTVTEIILDILNKETKFISDIALIILTLIIASLIVDLVVNPEVLYEL